MFLPLAQGVAGASAGFPAVQAGGPPAPAPRVVHVPRPVVRHHVKRPCIRCVRPPHHFNREHVRINVHNFNHNFNRDDQHRRHIERRHDRDFWRGDFKDQEFEDHHHDKPWGLAEEE
ncbi:hypothetical protein [Nonomuraea jiangxiensis]|uniref:Uncharacterized protein n=1 Tax=Nonomuraea jiangxiensis TaxID=633440 RepID=A0A1G8DF55_9ACTN|nr:hypothetical protein [Nonomuraea jiangxiensis]SDH56296.1 hypothetical protein SAMN05421869_102556 [Nonomuraea jiangxiensis]